MGRDEVLPREPRAIIKNILIVGHTRLIQESSQHFQATLHGSRGSFLAAEQTQQDFCVQVLAHFVDDAYILDKGLRLITGKHQRLVLQRAHGLIATTSRRRGVTVKVERLANSVWRVRWRPYTLMPRVCSKPRNNVAANSAGSSIARSSLAPASSSGTLPHRVN